MAHFANMRHYIFRSNGHTQIVVLPTAMTDHRVGFVRLTVEFIKASPSKSRRVSAALL